MCYREREKKLALVVERERDAVEGLVRRLQEKQDESEARYKQLIVERQQRAAELAHGPHSLLGTASLFCQPSFLGGDFSSD